MIVIDRCLCEKKRFADVLAEARAAGWDMRALAQNTGCGTHCGLCVAYLRRGLRTGEAVFHQLLDKEDL